MNKKKILYTIPNFDTAGSGKVVYDLVKGLDKQKFAPEICCFHNKGAFFKEIEKLGVKIHIFPFAINYRPFITFPFRLLKISWFFRKHKFDIIHSWHWSSDFSEPLAAKIAGIPYVYTKKAMTWGNKSWIWRSNLSAKIICINEDMVIQFFSRMKTKIVQIPLGVDLEYFKPFPKSYITPEGVQIDKNDFVIITVANLVPVKGVEVLLNAVNKIKDNSIKVFVIGANENDYGKGLMAKFKSKRNWFLGKKDDVRPYLSMADLFVIPTKDEGRKEGMPIAPLEAMAMGKIVVGSRISGITDILKEFPDNLFEAGNMDELVNKIIVVKSFKKEERILQSERMRNYVVENLSLDKFVRNHEEFYPSLKS